MSADLQLPTPSYLSHATPLRSNHLPDSGERSVAQRPSERSKGQVTGLTNGRSRTGTQEDWLLKLTSVLDFVGLVPK